LVEELQLFKRFHTNRLSSGACVGVTGAASLLTFKVRMMLYPVVYGVAVVLVEITHILFRLRAYIGFLGEVSVHLGGDRNFANGACWTEVDNHASSIKGLVASGLDCLWRPIVRLSRIQHQDD
jgi:hypothetical protein